MIQQTLSTGAPVTSPTGRSASQRHDAGNATPPDDPPPFALGDATEGSGSEPSGTAPEIGLAHVPAASPRAGAAHLPAGREPSGRGHADPAGPTAWRGAAAQVGHKPTFAVPPLRDPLAPGVQDPAGSPGPGPASAPVAAVRSAPAQQVGQVPPMDRVQPGKGEVPAGDRVQPAVPPPGPSDRTHVAAPHATTMTDAARAPQAVAPTATAGPGPMAEQAPRDGPGRATRAAHPAASPRTQPGPAGHAGPRAATDRADTAPAAVAAAVDIGSDPGTFVRESDAPRVDPGRGEGPRTDLPRSDVARAAGNQLVEAVRQGPNGTTEVALNPEELGRVRLGLSTQDGVLHVSITAERPETQDMLRRHIATLQTDFRALGYTDVAFDFGAGGDQPPRPSAPEPIRATDADAPDQTPTASDPAKALTADAPPTGMALARLDRRV